MLRKWIALFTVGMLTLALVGCSDDEQIDATTTGDISPVVSQSTNDTSKKTEDNTMNNCRLLINGKEVLNQHYARIDADTETVELPVLRISTELGAKIKWIDSYIVEISYMEKTERINTQEESFGIPLPPGAIGSVRRVIDKEIIMDYISIKGLFENMMEANVRVDYNASIIYVDSITK